jgi:hypothetical protein
MCARTGRTVTEFFENGRTYITLCIHMASKFKRDLARLTGGDLRMPEVKNIMEISGAQRRGNQ